jgi:cell division protein FtsB
MALCRALYKKQLSQGHKHHTLLFYVHGQDVYLAVLRKTNLDYVRHLGRVSESGQAAFESWSMDQIRAVVQYYEMELGTKGEEELSWQFILASDSSSVGTEKLKEELEKSFSGSFISLRDENAMIWLPIEKNPKIDILPLSATGAALRKWTGSGQKTEIDLLPERTRKIRIVAEYFISTSKIAAAVLLLILFLAYVLSARAGMIRNDSRKNSKATTQENIEQLLTEKKDLAEQLVKMNKQKEQAEAMMGGYSVGSMAKLLDQIRQRTPAAVRMTRLWYSREGTVGIEGHCPAMEDIQNYARLLETAAYVKTVHVRQSETDPQNLDVRSFAIICTLKDGI